MLLCPALLQTPYWCRTLGGVLLVMTYINNLKEAVIDSRVRGEEENEKVTAGTERR